MKLTLGRAHELGLCVALTTSVLIVLLGGEFPPWAWLGAFAPVLGMMVRRREIVVPSSSGTLLALAAVGAGVATFVRGGLEAAVFAAGATLVGLLAARVLTARTIAHDLQSIALSLVLVLAGSVLNVGISYFLGFVAYAISTVWALSTRQLLAGAEGAGARPQQARDRDDVVTPLFFVGSGAVSLAVLGAAVLVFVAFPRIGFGELGILQKKNSQLPGSVGFGSDPRGLSTSTALVARVRGVSDASFNDGLYLRGIVYDEITLDAFSQSSPEAVDAPVVDIRPMLPSLAHNGEAQRYQVSLTPLAGDLLFVLGHVRVAQVAQGGTSNPNRTVFVSGRDRHDELKASSPLASPVLYDVNGDVAAAGRRSTVGKGAPALTDVERQRFLKVPVVGDDIRAILREALIGAAADDVNARAEHLRNHLLQRYRYSLDGGVSNRDEALRVFLTEVRAGHCELFAGAYALLLRLDGIPARVVGGFQGGARAPDGSIVFQQRHAHAWVEWWEDGAGWRVDDATPEPSDTRDELTGVDALVDAARRFWDDRVVDYALADQQDALRSVTSRVRGHNLGKATKALVAIGASAGVVALIVRRFWRRRRRGATADVLAREILAAVTRLRGAAPATTMTLREATLGLEAAVFGRAVVVYERARFGGVAVDVDEQRRLIESLRALRPAKTPPVRR